MSDPLLESMTARLHPAVTRCARLEESRYLTANRVKRIRHALPPIASGEWHRIRFDVLKRDGFRCTYCGVTAREARLEVDHIRSRHDAGATKLGNLTTACHACNVGKGRRSL